MTARISAAVCTYDRYERLERCIANLREQTLPEHEYEIIVVDNSPDPSAAGDCVARCSGIPNLRYVHNTPPGLSRARNRAFAECRTPYIAYTDDDAVADPRWLERIVEFLEVCGRDVGSLTGKVLPLWECDRPAWLEDRLLGCLSVVDWGAKCIELGPDQYPVGANVAYNMTAVRSVGMFSTKFGRCGRSLMSNEECEYRRRLEAAGWKTYYAPDVIVCHAIPAERGDDSVALPTDSLAGYITRRNARERVRRRTSVTPNRGPNDRLEHQRR